MRRRYVYDVASDVVVEVGVVRGPGLSPLGRYQDAKQSYREHSDSPVYGRRLREATLERAARREFADRKYGTESRWSE